MSNRIKFNKSLYKPLRYFIYFVLLTLFLSLFGPKEYRDYNKVIVVVYIFLFLLFFSFGFIRGTKVKLKNNYYTRESRYKKILLLVKYSIIISFSIVFYDFIIMFIKGNLNFSISSIGQNYIDFNKYRNYSYREYNLQTILFFLGGFPKLVTIVLGLFFFPKLKNIYKYMIISVILLTIFTRAIAIGNLIALGNIILFIIVVSYIKMLDFSATRKIKILKNIVIYTSLAFVLFVIVMAQRLEAVGATAGNINSRLIGGSYFNFDNVIFKVMGFKYGLPIAYFITGYLSGGYYGLSLCLQLPFVWTYGIGNSYTLSVFFERFIGLPAVLDKVYPIRMEMITGWKGLQYWNTIFPWMASDFTFIGTLFIFIPIAYFYAISWKEIILYRNPVSILFFTVLTLGLLFVPMNNQLLHGINNFIMTIITIFFWIKYHTKYNIVSTI